MFIVRVTCWLVILSCMITACGKKGPLDSPVPDKNIHYPAVYPKEGGDDQDFSTYENEDRE